MLHSSTRSPIAPFLSILAGVALLELPVAAQAPYTLVGTASTLGSAARNVIRGRWVYVSTSYGIEIYNVSNPAAPVTLGKTTVGAGAYDLVLGAVNYLFLADNTYGVQIIDVLNPHAPVPAGSIAPTAVGGQAFGVEVAGDRLYVFCGGSGMRIFDLTPDPTNPTLLGTHAPIGVYHNDGVAFGSGLLCVADGGEGVTVFDVSNPSAIVEIADTNSAGISFDVALVGDLLASVSGIPSQLQTYDVTLPIVDPLVALDGDTSGGFVYFDVDARQEADGKRYAYVANFYGGCEVWSIDNPTNIQLLQTVAATTGAAGVTYHRGFLFVGAKTGGLQIYHR